MLETLDGLKLAANVEVLGGAEEVLDTRMSVIIAAKYLLGLVDPLQLC